jgi:hypothetical protein
MNKYTWTFKDSDTTPFDRTPFRTTHTSTRLADTL